MTLSFEWRLSFLTLLFLSTKLPTAICIIEKAAAHFELTKATFVSGVYDNGLNVGVQSCRSEVKSTGQFYQYELWRRKTCDFSIVINKRYYGHAEAYDNLFNTAGECLWTAISLGYHAGLYIDWVTTNTCFYYPAGFTESANDISATVAAVYTLEACLGSWFHMPAVPPAMYWLSHIPYVLYPQQCQQLCLQDRNCDVAIVNAFIDCNLGSTKTETDSTRAVLMPLNNDSLTIDLRYQTTSLCQLEFHNPLKLRSFTILHWMMHNPGLQVASEVTDISIISFVQRNSTDGFDKEIFKLVFRPGPTAKTAQGYNVYPHRLGLNDPPGTKYVQYTSVVDCLKQCHVLGSACKAASWEENNPNDMNPNECWLHGNTDMRTPTSPVTVPWSFYVKTDEFDGFRKHENSLVSGGGGTKQTGDQVYESPVLCMEKCRIMDTSCTAVQYNTNPKECWTFSSIDIEPKLTEYPSTADVYIKTASLLLVTPHGVTTLLSRPIRQHGGGDLSGAMVLRVQYDDARHTVKVFLNEKVVTEHKVDNIYKDCEDCQVTHIYKGHPPDQLQGTTTVYNYILTNVESRDYFNEMLGHISQFNAEGYKCYLGIPDIDVVGALTPAPTTVIPSESSDSSTCATACSASSACYSFSRVVIREKDAPAVSDLCYLHNFVYLNYLEMESKALLRRTEPHLRHSLATTCVKEPEVISGYKSHFGAQPSSKQSLLSSLAQPSTSSCAALCDGDPACHGFQTSRKHNENTLICSIFDQISIYSDVDYKLRPVTETKEYLTSLNIGYRKDNGACPSGRFGDQCGSTTHCAERELADTADASIPLCPREKCEPGFYGEACQSRMDNIVGLHNSKLLDAVRVHGKAALEDSRCASLQKGGTLLLLLDYSWQPATRRDFLITGVGMSCSGATESAFRGVFRFAVRRFKSHSSSRFPNEDLSYCSLTYERWNQKFCTFSCLTIEAIDQYFLLFEDQTASSKICSVVAERIA